MALLYFLTGRNSLRTQRNRAQDFAREQYDPSVFDPMVTQAQTQATEGIGDAGDIARARTVQSLFSPTTTSLFSGNQGRALANQQMMTGQRQQALAGFESDLTQADIQARQQGQQQFAQARSQQLQTQAQQDAAIAETQMQYEAELDRRRQALGGAALGLVGSALTTPLGGAVGGTIAGNVLGSIFGGGGDAETPQPETETDLSQYDLNNLMDFGLGGFDNLPAQPETETDISQYDLNNLMDFGLGGFDFLPSQEPNAFLNSQPETETDISQYDLNNLMDFGLSGFDDVPATEQDSFNLIDDMLSRDFNDDPMSRIFAPFDQQLENLPEPEQRLPRFRGTTGGYSRPLFSEYESTAGNPQQYRGVRRYQPVEGGQTLFDLFGKVRDYLTFEKYQHLR